MKVAVLIARVLLGIMFLFFGLNGFLNFLHAPMPAGPAGQYMGVLYGTFYFHAVFLLQIIGALLLLSGQWVPLGLTLLAPIIVNILLFHISFQPAGLPPALLATILWLIVFLGVYRAFAGIFAQKPAVS